MKKDKTIGEEVSGAFMNTIYLDHISWLNILAKELPRVNRAQDPFEDQKSQLLSFSEI